MAQKALGKARKSGAEGESLKLLKESGAIFSLRTLFHLRLPCHCDEGKQDGDNGLLVHTLFLCFFYFILNCVWARKTDALVGLFALGVVDGVSGDAF